MDPMVSGMPQEDDQGIAKGIPQYSSTAPPPMIMAAPMASRVFRVNFGQNPMQITCPYCQKNIVTQVRPVSGLLTYLISGGLIAFGCWLGCCLFPFYWDECKDFEHVCPECHSLLGKYRRLQ